MGFKLHARVQVMAVLLVTQSPPFDRIAGRFLLSLMVLPAGGEGDIVVRSQCHSFQTRIRYMVVAMAMCADVFLLCPSYEIQAVDGRVDMSGAL